MNLPALLILSALAVFDEHAGLGELPHCTLEEGADRSTWGMVSAGTIQLLLPESFEESGPSHFVHGGKAWKSSSSSASVIWGHWGRSSFLDVQAQFCQIACGSELAVVVEIKAAQDTEFALFVEPTGLSTHRPMVTVSTPAAERPVAIGVIQGACELHEPAIDENVEAPLPSGLTNR